MNIPVEHWYRLVPRGGAGLVCDNDGLALGAVALARARHDERRVRRCDVRPPHEIGRVLQTAYGPQPDEVVLRLHRGLGRAAKCIEAGDLCRAGIEAVMLGVPDLTPEAMTKLAEVADLEKGGAVWQNEPRIPAAHTGGGQWTTDGAAAPPIAAKPARAAPAATVSHNPSLRNAPAESVSHNPPPLPLEDGVYRPDRGRPVLTLVGGAEENEEPRSGSNGPPDDFTRLQDVFPGLKDAPGLGVPLAPVDGFFSYSALADASNLAGTVGPWRVLVDQIKAVDPRFSDDELLPLGGIAALSWQGRNNLIAYLRMQRAVAFYKIRGDVGPLQVETLRFLQKAVDNGYAEGVKEYDAGKLRPYLSREEAIGNYLDPIVRRQLRDYYDSYTIVYGPRRDITINNRDYDTSSPQITYTVPDARVGNISFDWTLTPKTISYQQVRGFFGADSRPIAVVIVRPAQLGPNSTYLIPRPAVLRPRR